MLIALAVAAALAVAIGVALGWAASRIPPDADPLVARIDALLPQTQCGQCQYAGCRPYAAAIAAGEADINRCPP
ncbi:MAG: RnfABCDGE type electron transport complex subunit B, partial [Gammaproteobacteria bacterium]|nr:RnfABCDGE type electron transport complex subunit B [Gammaproteobacteria bacterium]